MKTTHPLTDLVLALLIFWLAVAAAGMMMAEGDMIDAAWMLTLGAGLMVIWLYRWTVSAWLRRVTRFEFTGWRSVGDEPEYSTPMDDADHDIEYGGDR